MKNKIATTGVLVLGVFAGACGGAKTPPATTASTSATKPVEPKDDVFRGITQAQLKVAHYASADGTVGIVLDRTSTPAKLKVDGSQDIVELTMVEDRGSGHNGWYLKSPTGKNLAHLSAGGDVSYFTTRDELVMNSDKAAEALGPATVKGQYVEPKSAYDSNVEKVKALTILSKMPRFKPQDSGNLAKVSEVLGTAPAESFVHLTDEGAKRAHWAPASAHIDNTNQGLGGAVSFGTGSDKWDRTKPGLSKYGVKLLPMMVEFGRPNRLRMHAFEGFPPPLQAKTAGVVWEINDSSAVFVAVDGGRYEIAIPSDATAIFEPGAGPAASWPPAMQHVAMDVDSVRGLAKGGAVAEAVGKDVESVDDGWFTCVNDLWKTTKTELDKNEAAAIPANDKWGRATGIRKSAELKVPTKCAPEQKKLETWLVTFYEARTKERQAIFDKVKARGLK